MNPEHEEVVSVVYPSQHTHTMNIYTCVPRNPPSKFFNIACTTQSDANDSNGKLQVNIF